MLFVRVIHVRSVGAASPAVPSSVGVSSSGSWSEGLKVTHVNLGPWIPTTGLILISIRKSEVSGFASWTSQSRKENRAKAGRDGWGLGAAEIARGGTCVIRFFDFVSSAHGLLIRLLSLSFLISHPCLFLYPKMWARSWWAGAYDVTAGQQQPPGLLEVCGLSSL